VNINAPPSMGRLPRITHMVLDHNHEVYSPSEDIRKQVTKMSSEQLQRAQTMGLMQGMGRRQVIKVPAGNYCV
jgi:hypothetical protein